MTTSVREFTTKSESASDPAAHSSADVLAAIGSQRSSGIRRWMWRGIGVFGLVAAVAVFFYWRSLQNAAPPQNYVFAQSKRADLRATVTATGTVNAVDQVDVGTAVSGTVEVVHVDYNDRVSAGQVLCEIDDSQHRANTAQSRAQLHARQAELKSALANAKEITLNADRSRALFSRGLTSKRLLEAAEGALAKANAQVASARAQIALARAILTSAEITLAKTTIRSPIDGVVLSRNVEPGQTVAASFATPVLFKLAKDLTKMEVEVDIDEADIGKVAEHQKATFRVDAYPERTFQATLAAIRNISTIVDNVVTYRSVLNVENNDLALRPGMTATVTIVTAEKIATLLVPNSALRFTPPELINRDRPSMSRIFGGKKNNSETKERTPRMAKGPTVWVLRNGNPFAIAVTKGLSNEEWTEVVDTELQAGTDIIIDAFSGGS